MLQIIIFYCCLFLDAGPRRPAVRTMAIAAPPQAAKGTEQVTPLQLGYTMPGDFLLQISVTSETADIHTPSFGTDPACAKPPSARISLYHVPRRSPHCAD